MPPRTGIISHIVSYIGNGAAPSSLAVVLENEIITYAEAQTIANSVRNFPLDIYTNAFHTLEEYIEKHPELIIKELCVFCSKEIPGNEGMMQKIWDFSSNKKIEATVCKDCYFYTGGKNSKQWKCTSCGVSISKSSEYKYKCELFDKCSSAPVCPTEKCREAHNRLQHKTYWSRKWKCVKKYITNKPGNSGKYELPTGVEFEVIGAGNTASRKKVFKLNRHIGIGEDLSIRDFPHAMEIQTPPANGRRLEKLMYRVCDSLETGGYTVNAKCGTHIHLDLYKTFGRLSENPQFYKSLLAAYTYFEPWWFSVLPKSRGDNRFVQHLRPRYQTMMQQNRPFYMNMKFSKIWYLTREDSDIARYKAEKNLRREEMCSGSRHHLTKYMWVNFHSLIRGEGLEIRSLEGTIDSDLILKWIDLHTQFILAVSQMKKPFHTWMYLNNMEKQMNGKNWKVFEKELFEMIPFSEKTKEFIKMRHDMHSRSTTNNSPSQVFEAARIQNPAWEIAYTSISEMERLRNRNRQFEQGTRLGGSGLALEETERIIESILE